MSDTTDELGVYVVPDLTVKQLLDAIPCVCLPLFFFSPQYSPIQRQGALLQALCAQVDHVHVGLHPRRIPVPVYLTYTRSQAGPPVHHRGNL
jgi:hypothetical protein